MINSISSIGLSGLHSSLDYFETASTKVSSASASAMNSTVSSSTTGTSPTSSDVLASLNESDVSLEESITDLLLAKRFVQFQVGVIHTEDEMLAEVVNLGRRRGE